MFIEEVDARGAADDVLARFHALETACHDELRPGEPHRSLDEVIAFYRHQPASRTARHWLTEGGGASLVVHGPTAAFVQLLVDPAKRRRRIGTKLLERVVESCRELEVAALSGHHSTPAGAQFAARHGASDAQRIVRSFLALRDATLPAQSCPEGWKLATWLGRVPDEHLEAYVHARTAMDDAPAPGGVEFPAWTAETVRASEDSLARREREMRLTVALDPVGEVGAFTELRVSRGSTLAFTDDTGTVAAQRGKGLARAVKLESLRRLRSDHPEVEAVATQNAEENAAMLHLNGSLGFRPVAVVTTAVLDLQAAGEPSGPARGRPR